MLPFFKGFVALMAAGAASTCKLRNTNKVSLKFRDRVQRKNKVENPGGEEDYFGGGLFTHGEFENC